MRVLSRAAVAAILVLLLAGCGRGAGGTGGSPTPASPSDPPVAAGALYGFWRVHDAAGEGPDTWVRFDPVGITLFRAKGLITFSLAAQGDAIVASRSSWSMSLGADDTAPWLSSVASIARSGAEWRLLDDDGRVAARLVRDGRPAESSQYETEPTPSWVRDRELRNAVAGPGAEDVVPADLRGRWVLDGHREAWVEFAADGTWRNKPSCESGTGANPISGAYRVLPGGFLLATAGGQTAIGCGEPEGAKSPDLLAITDVYRARSIRVVDDRLTLFDVEGEAIGSLVR